MYALLKHIHRACWDLLMTNNRRVKCVSVTSVYYHLAKLQWIRNWDGAPTSRGSPDGLCQSRLSPNYHLRLSASLSSQHLSAASLSPSSCQSLRKWTAQLNSMGNTHTHIQASHTREGDWKDFINSVYYLLGKKSNENNVLDITAYPSKIKLLNAFAFYTQF